MRTNAVKETDFRISICRCSRPHKKEKKDYSKIKYIYIDLNKADCIRFEPQFLSLCYSKLSDSMIGCSTQLLPVLAFTFIHLFSPSFGLSFCLLIFFLCVLILFLLVEFRFFSLVVVQILEAVEVGVAE